MRAVKKRVGERIVLMCDFNQRLSVAEAIARGRALDDEGLYWIEEPTVTTITPATPRSARK